MGDRVGAIGSGLCPVGGVIAPDAAPGKVAPIISTGGFFPFISGGQPINDAVLLPPPLGIGDRILIGDEHDWMVIEAWGNGAIAPEIRLDIGVGMH